MRSKYISTAWVAASLVCMFRVGTASDATWWYVLPAFVGACLWMHNLCDDVMRG